MMKILVLFCILFISFPGFAQDIFGGEIIHSHISGTTYQTEQFLYTQTSMGIQHQGTATNLPGDITEWHITETHTFPGPGTYEISLADSFRISGIQNILNSSAEGITLKAMVVIDPFVGVNSSPIFSFNQIDIWNNGGSIYHNAIAYDPDGDSIVYELIPATSSNYNFPTGATIDPVTGLFQMPLSAGTFAINIEVKEFRNGINIGAIYREMIIDTSTITNITNPEVRENNLIVFPNPTTGKVNISTEKEIVKMILYDLTGKEILVSETFGKSIDLGNFESGIYFIEIIDGKDSTAIKKIIKNNLLILLQYR